MKRYENVHGLTGLLTRVQALRCLSVLPPSWRAEISNLGEGQAFKRMGKAWFYLPPHDEEDCLWEAVVKNGILHVECEVGRDAYRRKFEIPLTAITGCNFEMFVGTDAAGKTVPGPEGRPPR